jgi:hypothetical protein
MATPSRRYSMQDFIMRGLILGYIYSILLSASGIIVCELRGKPDCNSAWAQGYAVATGLVTTFLAYFVQPGAKPLTSRSKPDDTEP